MIYDAIRSLFLGYCCSQHFSTRRRFSTKGEAASARSRGSSALWPRLQVRFTTRGKLCLPSSWGMMLKDTRAKTDAGSLGSSRTRANDNERSSNRGCKKETIMCNSCNEREAK